MPDKTWKNSPAVVERLGIGLVPWGHTSQWKDERTDIPIDSDSAHALCRDRGLSELKNYIEGRSCGYPQDAQMAGLYRRIGNDAAIIEALEQMIAEETKDD